MCSREVGIGTAFRFRAGRNGWLVDGKQSPAKLEFVLTDAIGEETELADADQPGGQYVQQKAADEFNRV